MSRSSTATTVARAVAGGGIGRLRGRTLVAVVAIASGVALGYAVELVNRAAIGELVSGLATLSGDADLELRGPREGFDERLYPCSPTTATWRSPVRRRGRRHDRRPQPRPPGDGCRRLSGRGDQSQPWSRPPATGSIRCVATHCSSVLLPLPGSGLHDGDHLDVRAGSARTAPAHRRPCGQRGRDGNAALRRDGHRRGPAAVRSPRPADADRPAAASRGRPDTFHRTPAAQPARGRGDRRAIDRCRGELAALPRLPRESRRPGAGRAVHRRHAGVRDAGAVADPAQAAVRAAAHPRPVAPPPRRTGGRRSCAAGRSRDPPRGSSSATGLPSMHCAISAPTSAPDSSGAARPKSSSSRCRRWCWPRSASPRQSPAARSLPARRRAPPPPRRSRRPTPMPAGASGMRTGPASPRSSWVCSRRCCLRSTTCPSQATCRSR